jgi:PAS domain-containing protein
MVWGKIWRFLTTPIGFIQEPPKVEDSEEYQRLERDNDELNEDYSVLERDFEELGSKHRILQRKEAKQAQHQHGLIIENSRLLKRIRELELEFRALNLGKHLLSDSTIGVLVFDSTNMVVDANEAMCRYLQVEKPELKGDSLESIGSIVPYFNIYANFFGEVARARALRKDIEIKPNRFEINGVAFDIMGYSTRTGTEGVPVYDGGFLLLSPLKERSFLERWRSGKTTVTPEKPLAHRIDLVEVYMPLMDEHARHHYIDLVHSSMTEEVMESLFKLYQCMRNSDYTLTFKNVSERERDYLIGLGINERFIRGIRTAQTQEDTGQHPAIETGGV